jgi:prepilin-type processing-associated H-X9-DG protein
LGRPDQLDEFADVCSQIPPAPADYGWRGDRWARGMPWIQGDVCFTLYNHVLPPNRPSCYNGSAVQTGAATAASLHAGGVNMTFADGHSAFISTSVDRAVWRAFGSRIESDILR